MSASAPATAPALRTGRIRVAGGLLVAVLATLIAAAPRLGAPLREAWFDGYQRVLPRVVGAMPATVVEIDARSLEAVGRWPWPRSTLAELVERVGAHEPAALGLDILMPEPDAREPPRSGGRPTLATNDAALARALAATPSVLAVAGIPEPTGVTLRAAPISVQGTAEPGRLALTRFAGALVSVDQLNAAASGWGLVSVDVQDGVVRRVPLVADLGGTLVGALTVEMFRVAARERALRLVAADTAVRGVAVGNAFVATEPDGHVRLHFSPRHAGRFVSAVDVLHGRVDAAQLRRRLVLIAATGIGLGDYHATPVGERMPGVEVHAQLLESLFEGTLLDRPRWAPFAEAAAFALAGLLIVWATPLWKPRNAAALALASVAGVVGAGYAAFAAQRLLFDAATPGAGLALVFVAVLVATLAEATRQRRLLEAVLQRQREQAARIAGELDAARRIQMAMLPRADALAGEGRVDVAAAMLPAREVGGDLYDFFRLDDDHLFCLVGDVAGKGLPASLFMAVSKALYKSTTLRARAADMGALMTAANAEIARDNPEMLFVSAFAGVLDLATGEFAYCNAGHDNPVRIPAHGAELTRIADGDGPPLCVIDDYTYRGATLQLAPGEALCIVTDGVPEARDASGAMFGGARLDAVLAGLTDDARSARAIVDAVCRDVASFTAGAEPYDDVTVLAVRWRGADGRA